MSESTDQPASPASPEAEGPDQAEKAGSKPAQAPLRATSATTNEVPAFGWSGYAERVNGRFAMLGFVAVLLIETLTGDTFLHWAGLVP